MSTSLLAMNLPLTVGDIVTVHVDQKIAHECYVASFTVKPINQLYKASPRRQSTERKGISSGSRGLTRDRSREIISPRRKLMVALVDLEPRLNETRIEPGEDLHPLPVRDEEHATHIGTSLKTDDNKLVSQTLIDNADLFAWTTLDTPRVSTNIITHRLSIYKEAKLFVQKKRKMGEEKCDVACQEVDKLVKVGFIKKAHYTTWLANVVMVKKSNDK